MDHMKKDLVFTDGSMEVFDVTSEFSTYEEYKEMYESTACHGRAASQAWSANNGGAGYPPLGSEYDAFIRRTK